MVIYSYKRIYLLAISRPTYEKLRKRLNNEQPEPIYFSLDFSVVIASFYFRSTLKEKKMNSLKFKHQVARGKHFSKNLIIMSHAILVLVCTIMQ